MSDSEAMPAPPAVSENGEGLFTLDEDAARQPVLIQFPVQCGGFRIYRKSAPSSGSMPDSNG